MTLEPPASSSSCSKIVSQTINNAYFRVGELEKSNSTYSRKKYDTNQFYFRLGRSTSKDFRCPTTPNKLFTSFESSNSNLESRVVWKLEDKKSDDHFNISGSITTEKASFNNHFNYLTSSKPAENGSAACPTHFQVFALTKANNATMTGSVSASEAKLLWTFTDLNTHWTVKGNFSGTWWNQGAKLITTAAQPATTGQAVRIIPPRQSVWSKHRGYIVLGIVFGVVRSIQPLSFLTALSAANDYSDHTSYYFDNHLCLHLVLHHFQIWVLLLLAERGQILSGNRVCGQLQGLA